MVDEGTKEKILEAAAKHPEWGTRKIGKKIDISHQTVWRVLKDQGLKVEIGRLEARVGTLEMAAKAVAVDVKVLLDCCVRLAGGDGSVFQEEELDALDRLQAWIWADKNGDEVTND